MRRGVKTLLATLGTVATLGAAATVAGAAVPTAELMPGGRAIAPPSASAPPSVKAMIEAANHIRHRPYVWGGGGPGSWVRDLRQPGAHLRGDRRPALGHLDDRRRRPH